jgi:tRNA pseudouridine55 synthase
MTINAEPGGGGKGGRRRKGHAVHGWLILDKPSGVTSTAAVGRVRRLLDAAKAGHGGTLDPLATGVLPLAFGEATKTTPYLMDSRKSYRFGVRWGVGRATDDVEGEVTETSDVRPTKGEIEAALDDFLGDIAQVPPKFSAVKVDGQRAYNLARGGRAVKLAARTVRIERLALLSIEDEDHATFEMDCGKGTYVRALVRDLAHALGICGHVTALCRTRVGSFTLNDAISLAELEALDDSGAAEQSLLPVVRGLVGIPGMPVNADQALRLKVGQAVPLVRPAIGLDGSDLAEGTLWTCLMDRPVALVELGAGVLKPLRVFNF